MRGNDHLPQLGAGEEYEMQSPDPFLGNWDSKTREHRLQRFTRMGFDYDDASKLADSRAWTGDVERDLGRGCGHELAVQIHT